MSSGWSSDLQWESHQDDGETAFREMDCIEKGVWSLQKNSWRKGLRNYDIFSCIRLESQVDKREIAERALHSWQELRLRHPTLTFDIADDRWHYRLPITAECENTFVVDNTSLSASELLPCLKSPAKPTLFYLSRSNEFLIHTTHVHVDAIGLMHLFSEFLHYLASPKTKDAIDTALSCEVRELPHPTEITFQTLEKKSGSDALQSIFDDAKESVRRNGILKIATKKQPSPTGHLAMRSQHFSADETNQIISCARKIDVSVTHFLHAALAHAIQAESEGNRDSNLAGILAINLRDASLSKSKRSDKTCALRLGLGLVHTSVGSFQETAQGFKKSYGKALSQSPIDFSNKVVQMFGEEPHATQEMLSTIFSSFGDLSPHFSELYGDFKLCDFWAAAGPAVPCVYVSAKTIFGKLGLRLLYHTSFYDAGHIENFFTSIESVIREQLSAMV